MTRLVFALLLSAASALARPMTYAIAIGNNAPPLGAETLPTLQYADDDAARFFQFFRSFTDDARLLSVLDRDTQRRFPELGAVARPPTLAEVHRVVAELAERVRADVARGEVPTIYLSFSGHGAQDEEGAYLALSDGRLTTSALYDEVLTPLQPAFVHLFIDACHAEGVVAGRGDVDVPTVALSPAQAAAAFTPTVPARFPRLGALWATTVDQQSHEWSRIEAGLFSHEVLSALSGAADVNGDGVIEYSEVQAFVAAANRDLTDARAIPRVTVVPPRIDVHTPLLTLSRLSRSASLVGRFGFGRFFVELANGQRVLDAHLASSQAARVVVPAGRLFVVTAEGEAELELAPGERRRVEELKLTPRAMNARGSLSAALQTELFRSAFDAPYYKGFVDSRNEVSVVFPAPGEPTVVQRVEQRKTLATGAFVTSGVLFVGALGSGIGALVNFAVYRQTDLQRPAAEAHSRTIGFATAAAVCAGLGAAAAMAGWFWWPKEFEVGGAVGVGGGSVSLIGRW